MKVRWAVSRVGGVGLAGRTRFSASFFQGELRRWLLASVVLALVLGLSAAPAWAAGSTYTVTSATDSTPGSCTAGSTTDTNCQLRDALAAATSGSDTIQFSSTVFASAKTITLTSGLKLSKSVTITGPGAGLLSISGNSAYTVLTINSKVTVSLSGVTITKGAGSVGGIYNAAGTLTLENSTVSGNSASFGGGGIDNAGGTLTLQNSTVSANSTSGQGGGIYNAAGTLTLQNSTVSGNSASFGDGGGIFNLSTLTLQNSTVSGNSASFGGGGIYNYGGMLTLQNSTVSGNSASFGGGGIDNNNNGTLTLQNSTVSANSADSGGGIDNYSTLTLQNSIVAGNTAAGSSPDIQTNSVAYTDNGGNVINTSQTATSNPLLAPLGSYGGPTQTMPPLAGSPALDAGTYVGIYTTADYDYYDQIGHVRPSGTITSGAVQVTVLWVSNSTDTPAASPHCVLLANSGNCSLRDALGQVASASGLVSISFDPAVFPTAPGSTAQTITLTKGLTIASDVTITGPGANLLSISGDNNYTVLTINSGVTASLAGVTITRGKGFAGGGISNSGTLTLQNSTVSGNTTTSNGGGILSGGTLTLENSTVSGNTANSGGGIYSDSTLTLQNSTVSGNTAPIGGGIYNITGTLTLQNSTVSRNTASVHGSGIYNYTGTLTLQNSIVDGNAAARYPDIDGSYTDNGGNVANTSAFATSNPLLAPLGYYGGPTQTMPPLAGSPALNAGTYQTGELTTDQRGAPRPTSGAIDAGAVQVSGEPPVVGSVLPASGPMAGGTSVTITGTGFSTTENTVTFGDNSISNVSANSNGYSLTVSSPMTTTSGMVDVTVKNKNSSALTSAVSNYDKFTYFAPPSATVSFSPSSIAPNGASTLTITLTAPGTNSLSGVFFSDTLPSGLIVASTNGLTNSCGGTATATAGSGSVSLSGVALAAGNSCAVSVAVTSSVVGSYTDSVTPSDTSAGAGSVASDTLQVVQGASATSITLPSGTISYGSTVTATVAPVSPATGSPTGTVTFYIDGSSTGTTEPLSGGIASYPLSGLSAGTHTVAATYAADSVSPITGSSTTSSSSFTYVLPGYVVTSAGDDTTGSAANCPAGGGSGTTCMLRDALAAASATGGGVITFSPTVFATAQTITLSSSLAIPGNTTINGATSGSGATLTNLVTISGNGLVRVMAINSGDVTLNALNIIKGSSSVTGGGGISNNGTGTVTVMNSTLSGNVTMLGAGGGGIVNYSTGTVAVTTSTLSGNSSSLCSGGGISNNSTGTVTVTNSTLSGNSADGVGGGISNNSTGTVTVTNSTLSDNYADGRNSGGGISNDSTGTVTVANSTLSGNYTDSGAGGILNSGTGTVTVTNSIVNDSIIGTITNSGTSLIGEAVSLSVLGNYGGPTQTMVPLPGSAAICAGATASTSDQRGYSIPTSYGSTSCVDVGAVQTNYSLVFVTQPSTVVQNATMSPSPSVQLSERGVAFTGGAVTVPLTLSPNSATLTGGSATTVATVGTIVGTGIASYSGLSVNLPGTSDTLTASLVLNSALSPALSISATSSSFTVNNAVTQLVFGTAPAASIAAGSSAQTITVQEESATGAAVNTANDAITLVVTGPNSYSKSYSVTAVNGVANFIGVDVPTIAGSYSYSASTTVTGVSNASASQTVTAGTAAVVTANAGNNQSVGISTAFAEPLSVTVTDAYGNLVSGATVVFAAPSTGPGASFSTASTTNISGQTSVTATANSLAGGPYSVTASVTGGTTSASFSLSNTKGTASITLEDTAQTYTGAPLAVATKTSPSDLTTVAVTYTGTGSTVYAQSAAAPTNAGTYSVEATLTNTNYTGTAKGTLTIAKAGSTLSLSSSSSGSITPVQSVTLTAVAGSATAGTPTGSVSFYDGAALLTTVNLVGGTASYTVPSLSPGVVHTLTATYSGDTNFTASSTTSGVGETVAPLDFTLTFPANTLTVIPSSSVSTTFNLSPLYGSYAGPVSFTTAGLPAGVTAIFSPSTIAADGGAQSVTLTITAPPAVAKNHTERTTMLFALLLLPLWGVRKRKGLARVACLLLISLGGTAAVSMLTGCGTSNGTFAQAQQSYNVTVTATAGSLQHSATFTLVVE